MKRYIVRALAGACALLFATAAIADDAALKAAVAGPQRAANNTARDGARHPAESLAFWGLKPKQTVLELFAGGGYWTEILAPYAKATGGTYMMTGRVPPRYADESKFGKIMPVEWSVATAAGLGPDNSVDLVLTARNIHNLMWEPGLLDQVLKHIYGVLKPGGILAVEDHRADPRKQVQDGRDGYVNTDFVVAAAKKAGFVLDGKAEINANPKDTKDYPFGVWTLPPTNAAKLPDDVKPWPERPADSTYKDAATYKAIGESDRMTLRFKKPG